MSSAASPVSFAARPWVVGRGLRTRRVHFTGLPGHLRRESSPRIFRIGIRAIPNPPPTSLGVDPDFLRGMPVMPLALPRISERGPWLSHITDRIVGRSVRNGGRQALGSIGFRPCEPCLSSRARAVSGLGKSASLSSPRRRLRQSSRGSVILRNRLPSRPRLRARPAPRRPSSTGRIAVKRSRLFSGLLLRWRHPVRASAVSRPPRARLPGRQILPARWRARRGAEL